MKVLILAQKFDNYTIQRLDGVLRARGHAILPATPFELAVKLGGHPAVLHPHEGLKDLDVVLMRCSGFTQYTRYIANVLEFYIGVQLKYGGVLCVNDPEAKRRARDKFHALQILAQAGIPVPDSYAVGGTDSLDRLFAGGLDTPLALKLTEGTQGVGVIKADTLASARSVFEAMRAVGQVTTLQEYIDYKTGQDIRAIVVGKSVVAAMRRTAKPGEFRSNIHRGGATVGIDLPGDFAEIAVSAAQVLDLEIAGVDMLETGALPKVIEVNPTPGLEGIEEATGVDVAKCVVKHLEELTTACGQDRY